MIRAIEDGLYQPSMKERMAALEAEKAQLVAELAAKPEPTPVALHPNLPLLYRKKVEELEAAAGRPGARARGDGGDPRVITRIVLTPRPEGGMDGDARGRSGADPGDLRRAPNAERPPGAGGRSGAVPASQVSVVAGAGFEPATFRL